VQAVRINSEHGFAGRELDHDGAPATGQRATKLRQLAGTNTKVGERPILERTRLAADFGLTHAPAGQRRRGHDFGQVDARLIGRGVGGVELPARLDFFEDIALAHVQKPAVVRAQIEHPIEDGRLDGREQELALATIRFAARATQDRKPTLDVLAGGTESLMPVAVGHTVGSKLVERDRDAFRIVGGKLGQDDFETISVQVANPQLVAVLAHLKDAHPLHRDFSRALAGDTGHAQPLPSRRTPVFHSRVAHVARLHAEHGSDLADRIERRQVLLFNPQVRVVAFAARTVRGDFLDEEGLGAGNEASHRNRRRSSGLSH
jgi:hypothetical protein